MKRNELKHLLFGVLFIVGFAVWTLLIRTVDVQPVGQNGTDIGFATLNCRFHQMTGVHMAIYTITDWLGLVPIIICLIFAGIGLVQLIQRKNLLKVDPDILILGLYYTIVILGYLIFEMIPINYRPVLIDGFLEASYPSSTTLLVLSVMPTLWFQAQRRIKNKIVLKCICVFSVLFSIFMVAGRTVAGVHWLTDIIGSVLLSTGLFLLYRAIVIIYENN